MTKKNFKILAIDGGGIRGVFPAFILKCIEDRLRLKIFDEFDMIAGTSTGSIIAAGIASGKTSSQIVDLYYGHGKHIFGKKIKSYYPNWMKQGMHSKFVNENLEGVLVKEFQDTKLGDINKPLLIPSTDIGNGCVHVFKSSYSPQFTRDSGVLVSDAVLASCSAPTFFDPVKIDSYLLADGGVWANNPALAAVIEAKTKLGIRIEDIRILSLGTGNSKTVYGTRENRDWGLMKGWKGIGFIEFLLSLQAQSTQNYLHLLLERNQLLRLNFETEVPLPLDDVTALDDLVSRADKEFTYKSKEIMDFFKKDEV